VAKVKYLGTADRVIIRKGEKFAGRLSEGTTQDLVWDGSNNHLLDTDEAGLSEEALALLLEDDARFKDVTDMKRIPSSLNEQIFKGHKATVAADGEPEPVEDVDQTANLVAPAKGGRAGRPGGQAVEGAGSPTGGTTAAVGGSTAGT
jgi:hypothetical protein